MYMRCAAHIVGAARWPTIHPPVGSCGLLRLTLSSCAWLAADFRWRPDRDGRASQVPPRRPDPARRRRSEVAGPVSRAHTTKHSSDMRSTKRQQGVTAASHLVAWLCRALMRCVAPRAVTKLCRCFRLTLRMHAMSLSRPIWKPSSSSTSFSSTCSTHSVRTVWPHPSLPSRLRATTTRQCKQTMRKKVPTDQHSRLRSSRTLTNKPALRHPPLAQSCEHVGT